MKSFRLGMCIWLVIIPIFLMGQYKWDVKDPNGLNFIDFGDNKVIVYNGVGTALALWLSDNDSNLTIPLPNYSLGLQYFAEYKRDPLSDLYMVHLRKRYRIRDYLYIGGEGRLNHVRDNQVRTYGLGVSMIFEWHLIRKKNFRLIYDNGVGPNYFLSPFPFGGTQFNFTTHYGLLAEQKIGERWWSLGFYNIHISNAGIKGQDRNPALDAIGLRMSVSIF